MITCGEKRNYLYDCEFIVIRLTEDESDYLWGEA